MNCMVCGPAWPEISTVLAVILAATMSFISCCEGGPGSPSLKTIMCFRLAVDFFRA